MVNSVKDRITNGGGSMRKHYSGKFKAKVVVDVIKEQETIEGLLHYFRHAEKKAV